AKMTGLIGATEQEALQSIQALLRDSDVQVRIDAAVALWKIAPSRLKESVDALVEVIANRNAQKSPFGAPVEVTDAIGALGVIVPDAKDTGPLLLMLQRTTDSSIASNARRALKKVDPALAERARIP